MASGKIHGRNANFQIQDAGGTLRDFSGDLTSSELDSATQMAKSTGFGATDETFTVGLNDNKFSLKGWFDDTAVSGLYTVLSGIKQVFKTFSYSPAGTTAGFVKITGSACMSDFKIASPIGGTVTLDANFQVSGPLTFTTN